MGFSFDGQEFSDEEVGQALKFYKTRSATKKRMSQQARELDRRQGDLVHMTNKMSEMMEVLQGLGSARGSEQSGSSVRGIEIPDRFEDVDSYLDMSPKILKEIVGSISELKSNFSKLQNGTLNSGNGLTPEEATKREVERIKAVADDFGLDWRELYYQATQPENHRTAYQTLALEMSEDAEGAIGSSSSNSNAENRAVSTEGSGETKTSEATTESEALKPPRIEKPGGGVPPISDRSAPRIGTPESRQAAMAAMAAAQQAASM